MHILVVEDQALFCELLAKACTRWSNAVDAVAVGTAAAARKILREGKCEVMILDIRLPDMDGFEFASEAVRLVPGLKVIGISAYCDAYTAYRLIKSPLQAFIDKSTETVSELDRALEAVMEGGRYYSASIQTIVRNLGAASDSFMKLLSVREIDILREVGAGHSDERIGRVLKISPATVKWHRKQLMHKLALGSHSDLVIYANKQGFSDLHVR